jgi:hypothetical protein
MVIHHPSLKKAARRIDLKSVGVAMVESGGFHLNRMKLFSHQPVAMVPHIYHNWIEK